MRYYSLWYYNNHSDSFAYLEKEKNSHLISLGMSIRTIRKASGISQEELALSAGLDRSYLGSIERGERNVSYLTLVKIAQCLNCDVVKLINAS